MKSISLSIPYPPSVNRIYYNRKSGTNLRGRGLTKEAKDYKIIVANLIHYTFPTVKFGDERVKLSILDCAIKPRGDNHNGEKIVADAIELSGIINNDRQIVCTEILPYHNSPKDEWLIKLELYTYEQNINDMKRFFKES
jgi:Holliday junction resolvase RusA-like endonuclease